MAGDALQNIPVFSLSTGFRGRPSIAIPREQLELYLEYGFSLTKLAQLFCVSRKTVYHRMRKYGLEKNRYNSLSDVDLDIEM